MHQRIFLIIITYIFSTYCIPTLDIIQTYPHPNPPSSSSQLKQLSTLPVEIHYEILYRLPWSEFTTFCTITSKLTQYCLDPVLQARVLKNQYGIDGTGEAIKLNLRSPQLYVAFKALGVPLDTGLLESVKIADYKLISYLLELGADLHYGKEEVLAQAVRQEDFEMMLFLIDNGADIMRRVDDCWRYAVYNSDIRVLSYIIDVIERSNDNESESEGESERKSRRDLEVMLTRSLPTAILFGKTPEQSLKMVRFLVINGARVNFADNLPLITAFNNDLIDVALFLLDNGANVDAQDGRPIRVMAVKSNLSVIKILIEEYHANIHLRNDVVLLDAICSGNLELVEYLFSKGVRIENLSPRFDALVTAISFGYTDIVEYLIKHVDGVDVRRGESAGLKLAVRKQNWEIVRLLIANGGDKHVLEQEMRKNTHISNSPYDKTKGKESEPIDFDKVDLLGSRDSTVEDEDIVDDINFMDSDKEASEGFLNTPSKNTLYMTTPVLRFSILR